MRTILNFAVLTFLFVITSRPGLAMMSIADVSPARAKEMGMEVRSQPAGPDAVWLELEFKTNGILKHFNRVNLEIREGEKLLVGYASLGERRSSSGTVAVHFMANRVYLDKITLCVVVGDLGDTGYELRLKDFGELKNAGAAATPAEEERFVAAVSKAFAARDASGLDALTCWDRVPEKRKESIRSSYVGLVGEKSATFEFKLVAPERKFVDKDLEEDGVVYRANLPVTKQLNMTARDLTDKKILLVLTCAVGEKDGKLLLLGSAPVK